MNLLKMSTNGQKALLVDICRNMQLKEVDSLLFIGCGRKKVINRLGQAQNWARSLITIWARGSLGGWLCKLGLSFFAASSVYLASSGAVRFRRLGFLGTALLGATVLAKSVAITG